MTILDGKKLAQKILEELRQELSAGKKELRLGAVAVGKNPVIEKFLARKKKAADEIGVDFRIYPFAENITTNELRKRIAGIAHEQKNGGIIIQLPLPARINTQYILNSVMPEKDVDVLSARALGNFIAGKSEIMPPVAGAIKAFFEEYEIDYKNKFIVIIGAGNLVGKPSALWLLREKINFAVVEEKTPTPEEIIKKADIIILGIGKPGYLKGDWIKKSAVIIDAGTSESGGKISGDADFDSVSQKASFITPVPGGIGPVTVAMLLKNLVVLNRRA